ncbi:MAG: hypothetical protein WAU45_03020 [Blastocatellia bacterium]
MEESKAGFMTRLMSILAATMLLALATADARRVQLKQSQMIAHARRIDVSELDPRLPKQEFGRWLKSVLGRGAELTWEINDCGEQTGAAAEVERDIPTCVEVDAKLPDGRRVIVMIHIGTLKKGLSRAPTIKDTFLEHGSHSYTAASLSDLVRVLEETAVR